MLVTIFLLLFFITFYFIGRLKNDYGIIDVAWGLSFCVIILVASLEQENSLDMRSLIIFSAILIWGIRLSSYILYRNLKSGKEDYRYTQMREGWGDNVHFKAFTNVYLLQFFISLILGFPIYLTLKNQTNLPLTLIDYIGLGIWIIGFLFEVIADYQKNKFKQDPSHHGRVLKTGLWKFSRHPNYFGESLLWWGLSFVMLQVLPVYIAFVTPAILTLLLLKVSGVSLLEKKYEGDSEYDQYKQSTSSFIPWFPRKINE